MDAFAHALGADVSARREERWAREARVYGVAGHAMRVGATRPYSVWPKAKAVRETKG